MAELRLSNVSKAFAGKREVSAVRDLSLTVSNGECVALLGPSGAGKTTILRLIAGLESPSRGDIEIDGVSVLKCPSYDRAIGMAFQFPALLPQLNVTDNLRLGLKLRNAERIDESVAQISTLLGIEGLLLRKPETLSGGEQQRVALGRALITNPRLLLLDEPLASLDPISRNALRESIRKVQRELKLTVLYVTHDQTEAAAIADKIALLRNGVLQQFDSAQQLYREPRNLFTAQFFGPDGLNLFPADLRFTQNAVCAELDGVQVLLRTKLESSQRRELLVGFRPSDVSLERVNGSKWKVKSKRDLGWATTVQLGSAEHEINVQFQNATDLELGEAVNFKIDPAAVYLFEKSSGERVL